MILYNATALPGGSIRFAKFNADMNVEATYTCTFTVANGAKGHWSCDCPASSRPDCKHRKMVHRFALANAVNTAKFYCWETQTWHEPIQTDGEGEPSAERAIEHLAGAAGSCCGPTETSPLTIANYVELPPNANVAEEFSKLLLVGEAPEPSSLAAQPTPTIRRR